MPRTQATLPFCHMITRKHLKQRPLHCSWPHCKPAVLTIQQNRSVLSSNEQEHDHQRHKARCCQWSCTGHVSCSHTSCSLSVFLVEAATSAGSTSILTSHAAASGPVFSCYIIRSSTHACQDGMYMANLHHRSRKMLTWHWLWQKQ